jgi:hypothetical protein
VIQSTPDPWLLGPFYFRNTFANPIAAGDVILNLRTPAQRLDLQLAQIEGVAAGAGATNPFIAMLITGIAVRVPCLTPCPAITELARRIALRVTLGTDTWFWPLYEGVSTGPTSFALAGGEVLAERAARTETIGRVAPLADVMLNTHQVELVVQPGPNITLSQQPVDVIFSVFGAARDSNGWQRPASCRRGLGAPSSQANALVTRAPHAGVTLNAPGA